MHVVHVVHVSIVYHIQKRVLHKTEVNIQMFYIYKHNLVSKKKKNQIFFTLCLQGNKSVPPHHEHVYLPGNWLKVKSGT